MNYCINCQPLNNAINLLEWQHKQYKNGKVMFQGPDGETYFLPVSFLYKSLTPAELWAKYQEYQKQQKQ